MGLKMKKSKLWTIFDDHWHSDDDYPLSKPSQTASFKDYWKSDGDYGATIASISGNLGRLWGDYGATISAGGDYWLQRKKKSRS